MILIKMDIDVPASKMYKLSMVLFAAALCFSVIIFYNIAKAAVILYLMHKYVPRLLVRSLTRTVNPNGRGILITGCDSGLGHTFAKHLDSLGFHVFAGCFENAEGASRLKASCSNRLQIVPVDVTKDESVNRAFETVNVNLPPKGLWGVINNAGIDTDGEAEFLPISNFERCFGVNLYGQIRVAKRFLPLIRKTKGRIINITSVRGRMRQPRQGCYGSSKHMAEKFTDHLRLEMRKFGVKVIVIEPGNFAHCTSIENEKMVKRKAAEVEEMWNLARHEVQTAYTKTYVLSWTNAPITRGWNSDADIMKPVSMAVQDALCNRFPNARYLVDGYGIVMSKFDEHANICRIYNILPTWIIDKLIAVWAGSDELKVRQLHISSK